MKIFCSKDALLTGVNTVQKAVSSKSTLPILQGILIKAENNVLVFEATDMEIGIRCVVAAQIEREGTVVLPARLFSEIVRKLPDATIEMEQQDDAINIHYYESDIVLKGFDPEEFPLLPDLYDAVSFNLPISLFKTMIRQTVYACALEENRPVFTGTLLQIEDSIIRLVATDTHRLAYRIAEIENPESLKFYGVIPAKTLSEIYRLLKDDDEVLTIRFNQSQVSFQFGSVHLLSRLIDGQFPNYKQVIPQSCQSKVYLSSRAFTDAVERASLLARDSNHANIVRLTIEKEKLWIDQASEIGKISEQMDIQMEGTEVKVAFNAKFLLDVLKVIDSEQILIELSGPYGPGVIRPVDDPNYINLVLPVRTS
ncbi:DNA polymerase III subunit beta [Desulfitobacterium sp.]|uniref:DNA polymerase III subunit beta n=1 Tax=Desulfitobacterium sp. TaxID=49981 RepID=UPI002C8F4EEC|nr:DNA polymerase III subunit beta [Desulfitobacterium sp.]HVJ49106.1 DNA polymerase III subunit beta [Desulfitobacterium sp.]